MPRIVPHNDERFSWHGAISVQHTEHWTQAWRAPHDKIGLFACESLQTRMAMSTGVRLAFRTNATELLLRIEKADDESSALDLCCDGALVASADIAGKEEIYFPGLPEGDKVVELWLPQFGVFRLKEIQLNEPTHLARFEDDREKWVTYGSSITHCRTASSPTHTWPAIAARGHDLNLTCLGFGGQCHLDPMVARMIRDTPADYLSMKVGINIYGANSLSERTFRPAIVGAVQIIREKHPRTPFVLVSPIFGAQRESEENKVGFTLPKMRAEVAAAVELLRAHGDENIHYVDGLEIFGPQDAHLLPDNLHPNAEGYALMGQRFLDKVARVYFV